MRPRILTAVALVLLLACGVRADNVVVPPQQVIGAEQPVPLGELVVLSVSPFEKAPAGLSGSSYEWKVFDGVVEKRVMSDGNGNVFFGAGVEKKKFLAVVAVTHLLEVKEGDKSRYVARTSMLKAVVTVGAPTPAPSPEPQPGPIPVPSLPDGRFKLSATAYKLACDKVADGVSRVEGAKALAASFDGIASAVAAGAIVKPEDILTKTTVSNRKALGDAKVAASEWEQFSVALQDVIFELYSKRQISTKDDFKDAWQEISTGLKQVK